MSTQAQIEANRRNAQLSTGPKTPEGKARVALNALKHGIRAGALLASLQRTPLFDEDPQDFADLVQALVHQFQPEGPFEQVCVEDIAISLWRLRRVVCAETGHIASAQHILSTGPGAANPRLKERNRLPDFDTLQRLNRYESSIQRQLKRSFDTLTALIRQRSSSRRPGEDAPEGSHSNGRTSVRPGRGGGATAQDEIASLRRQILGFLLDELGPMDPESDSVAVPEESPLDPGPTDDEYHAAKQSRSLADPSNVVPSIGSAVQNTSLHEPKPAESPKQTQSHKRKPPNAKIDNPRHYLLHCAT